MAPTLSTNFIEERNTAIQIECRKKLQTTKGVDTQEINWKVLQVCEIGKAAEYGAMPEQNGEQGIQEFPFDCIMLCEFTRSLDGETKTKKPPCGNGTVLLLS